MCLGIVSVSRETRSFVLRCIKVDSMFHVKLFSRIEIYLEGLVGGK